jgi:hypothetical protein
LFVLAAKNLATQYHQGWGTTHCKASDDALPNVTTLMSLTQVATKGKGLRVRRENKQVGKA